VLVPRHPFVPLGPASSAWIPAVQQIQPTGCQINHCNTHAVNLCSILDLESVWSYEATHNTSQGLVTTSFTCNLPYFCICHLITSQLWHCLTCDWMVCCVPFQCIALQRVSLRCIGPGCCRNWWHYATALFCRSLGMTIKKIGLQAPQMTMIPIQETLCFEKS
jgi:hypothetical protein